MIQISSGTLYKRKEIELKLNGEKVSSFIIEVTRKRNESKCDNRISVIRYL